VFKAEPGCGLGQGSARLTHDQIGSVVLFLVPIGEDQEGMYFEAIFN
jgi:hypothetical protein